MTSHSLGSDYPTDQPTSSWPIYSPVNGATGSEGAANLVAGANNDGYVTAVETGYATQRGFPVAAVKNSNGKYVLPTELNVTTALSYATQLADGTHVLDFGPPSDTAYNPSTYSYLLVPIKGIDTNKGKIAQQFAEYCLTVGPAGSESAEVRVDRPLAHPLRPRPPQGHSRLRRADGGR